MDAEDQTSATRNSCPRVLGRRPAVPGKRPEVGRRVMLQSGVVRPEACSASARSASLSSRPAATSVSSWRSQCAASNSANQPRNLSSSAAERALMALSICSTFPMIRTLADRNILRPARGQRLPGAVAGATGMEEIRPVRRTAAPGCHRRNRHVSRRFCHRARCAAYPTSRLRAIVATPSGSTVDQASPRRQRQHFRVRDPEQYYADSKRSHSPAPSAISVRLRWLRAAFRLPKSSAPRRSAAIAQQPSARDARDCGERRPNTLLLGRSPRIGFQPLPERSRASARRTSRSRSLGPRIYGTVPSRQRSLSCSARWPVRLDSCQAWAALRIAAMCRAAHIVPLCRQRLPLDGPRPLVEVREGIYRRKAHFQLAIDAHALKVAKRGQEGLRRRAQRRSCESCRRRCVSAVATRTRHEPSSSKRDFPSRMRPTWQVAIRRSFSSWPLRRPLAIAMSTKPAFVSSNFPPIDANSFRAITAHAPFTRLMAYQRFPAACCAKR